MANYKLPWNYEPAAESLSLIITPSVTPYLPAIPSYFSGTGSYIIDGNLNAVATNWALSSNVTYANGNTATTTDATLQASVTEFGDYLFSIYWEMSIPKALLSSNIDCYIAKPTNYVLKYGSNHQLPKELIFYFPINERISLGYDNFKIDLTNFTNSNVTDNVTDFSSLVYSTGTGGLSEEVSMSTPPQLSNTDIADAGASTSSTWPYSITCSNVTTKTCVINTNCVLNGFDLFKPEVVQSPGTDDVYVPWHINFKTYDPTAVTTLYDSANRPLSVSNNEIKSLGDAGWYDAWTGAAIGDYSDNYGNILRTGYAIFNTGLTNTDIYQDYGITDEQQPASDSSNARLIYLDMKFSDSSSKQYRMWFDIRGTVNDIIFNGNDSVDFPSICKITNPKTPHWGIDYYYIYGTSPQWEHIADIYLYNAGETYTAPDYRTYSLTNNCLIIESSKTENNNYWDFPEFKTDMLKLIMKN